MRKLLLLCFVFISSYVANAQEIHRSIGVGLQTSFPVYGLSVKYGLNKNSVLQGIVAPFGASSGGASASINFYGVRYIYRFPGDDEKSAVLDPYLFGGGGLIHYSISDGYDQKTSDNIFSNSLACVIEFILLN